MIFNFRLSVDVIVVPILVLWNTILPSKISFAILSLFSNILALIISPPPGEYPCMFCIAPFKWELTVPFVSELTLPHSSLPKATIASANFSATAELV